MSNIISMVGCNAVGKSTAARRYVARFRFPEFAAVSADTQLVLRAGGEFREREWKGTVEEKKALVDKYLASDAVVLVESARTTHLEFVPPGSDVIVVTCDWKLYEKHMRTRCAAKGKKFRDDYWTEYKLQYESGRRYENYAAKSLTDMTVKFFEISDQAQDWPAVDLYFASVLSRRRNELVRRMRGAGHDSTNPRHVRVG